MTPNDLDEYLEHNDIWFTEDTIELAHHGILGMKWGRLNGPPYPIGRNSNTQKSHSASEKAAAKKAGVKVGSSSGKFGGKKSVAQIYKDHRKSKQVAENLQKARIAKADKAEHEKLRQEALNSGDPRRIKAVMNESTNDEIQKAVNRMNLYAQVNSKIPPEPTAMDKIDKAMETTKRIRGWVNTGMDVWNDFAKVYNSLNDDGDDLPELGKDNSNKKSGDEKERAKLEKKRAKWAEGVIKNQNYDQLSDDQIKNMTTSELKEYSNRLKYMNDIKAKTGTADNDNNENAEDSSALPNKKKKS